MARILVCAARNWSLVDEKTGEHKSGINIDGTEGTQNNDPDYKGRGAVTYAGTEAAWNALKDAQLPAICDVDIGTKKGRNSSGKSVAVASIEEVYSVHPIDFNVGAPVRKAAWMRHLAPVARWFGFGFGYAVAEAVALTAVNFTAGPWAAVMVARYLNCVYALFAIYALGKLT